MSVINPRVIKGITPSLQWLSELLAFFQVETIRIPKTYREKVLVVKRLLNDDPSGLANTMLDMAINAALVDYRIETDNNTLTKELNEWLDNINDDIRGMIPTGIDALAKEYFRERWKGSSNLLLRTFWSTAPNGLKLPTTMFFVDGEDIKVASKSTDGVLRLGDEQYFLKVGDPLEMKNQIKPKDLPLPAEDNEKIFVQRPFESWGVRQPTPFIIKRGIFRASKFMELMSSKGELIVGRALEYLFIMKKGTEKMALEGNVTYDEDDLRKAAEDIKDVIAKKKVQPGFPTFVTNFDTDIGEYIPDYKKVLDDAIYAPMIQKILSGLGLVEIVTSAKFSDRRTAVLNPKPFVTEINSGIDDFKLLLTDVIKTIIQENSEKHKKWMNSRIKIINSPVKLLIEEDAKATLRSLFDRGLLSKRTAVEIIGAGVDFDFEVQRRKQEGQEGLEETMYPPVIQNLQQPGIEENGLNPTPKNKPQPSKIGPEVKNYTKADIDKLIETAESYVNSPDATFDTEPYLVTDKEYEFAPFNTSADLPASVRKLPPGAQSMWLQVFNESLPKGEDYARKVAWSVVKKHYRENPIEGDINKPPVLTTRKQTVRYTEKADLIADQQIEINDKKIALLDALIEQTKKND